MARVLRDALLVDYCGDERLVEFLDLDHRCDVKVHVPLVVLLLLLVLVYLHLLVVLLDLLVALLQV